MIKDTRKFEDKYYNNRLVFINDVFERNITDNESIEVYADTGWKTSHDIRIYYESVKNKKHVSESYFLSPKLMTDLTDSTVIAICTDLLAKWRENDTIS